MFATHYHEMTDLENHRSGIKNYTMAVKELKDTIVFLRKIIPGRADRSYGIHVAQLAGIPLKILTRAKEVLSQLERSDGSHHNTKGNDNELEDSLPSPHPIIEEMKQMDLFSMTPLEALNRLADLQRRLDSE